MCCEAPLHLCVQYFNPFPTPLPHVRFWLKVWSGFATATIFSYQLVWTMMCFRMKQFGLVHSLLVNQPTRGATLDYLSNLLTRNSKRAQMNPDSTTLATHGFMLNALSILCTLEKKVSHTSRVSHLSGFHCNITRSHVSYVVGSVGQSGPCVSHAPEVSLRRVWGELPEDGQPAVLGLLLLAARRQVSGRGLRAAQVQHRVLLLHPLRLPRLLHSCHQTLLSGKDAKYTRNKTETSKVGAISKAQKAQSF